MKKNFLVIILILLVSVNVAIINADTLFVKIDDTVAINNNIDMLLYLDNIEYDNFTFKLYSSKSLAGVNTEDIEIENYNNEEITFDYCVNCSSLKTITLNYKLPNSIVVGDKITFEVEIINKKNTSEFKTYRQVVTVVEKKSNNEKPSTNFSKGNYSINNTKISSGVSTKYKGSSNNYLSNITIKGYELNKSFAKERLTYFVTVSNEVTSLDIKATKDNSKSTLTISGSSNLNVGLNKVLLTVTSEDGRTKNYRIYVTRMDSGTNEK